MKSLWIIGSGLALLAAPASAQLLGGAGGGLGGTLGGAVDGLLSQQADLPMVKGRA